MFNEGLDIPAVDRVIMLRPTESKVVFLQQFGRGLSAIEGKSRLLVIHFVGNRRIFAQRLIHLLSLAGEEPGWKGLKGWLQGEPPQLPKGCLLNVELAARDLLNEFIPKKATAGLEAYRAIRDELGRRPTASELFHRGHLPRAVGKAAGGWLAFVDSEGDLSEDERQGVHKFGNWHRTVETTTLNRSYQMVVLRVLLDHGVLFDGVDLPSFGRLCRRFMQDHPILRRDLDGDRHAVDHARADEEAWTAWWIQWPIDRWLNKQNGRAWFRRIGDNFVFASRNGAWHARPRDTREALVATRSAARTEGDERLPIKTTVDESARYTTHVPVYDVHAAAGGWGPAGAPRAVGWIEVRGQRLAKGMFAAQVSGRSMEPTIRDGQWCLFRPCPAGSRQGRLLLVQVNTHLDPEDGGRYTVKRYHSTKLSHEDGWQHQTIELQPLNQEHSTIHVSSEEAGDLRIIGEFVGVIRA